MRTTDDISSRIDWFTIFIYGILVVFGWLNIYAATYEASETLTIFDLSGNAGKQLIFIGVCLLIIISIMVMDFRFFETVSWLVYILAIIALLLVLVLARDINGAKSWFEIGGVRLQPSEITKFATALAVARYLSSENFKPHRMPDIVKAMSIFLLPMLLIILQKDAGTALVFLGFMLVLFREGMTPIPLIVGSIAILIATISILVPQGPLLIGIASIAILIVFFVRKSVNKIVLVIASAALLIGLVFSIDYVMNNVLKEHQRDRIKIVFNPNSDPLGKGWNITQSKIAIGSGGIAGKGYLNGTQTKYDFVPEQSTDFIFCTIGEEHGFLGSAAVVILFVILIIRIIQISDRQKMKFSRIYGYSIACIFLVHFIINIGMTIGLVPVIGIPLPFFSYGGSSLLSFTILLFIFLKLDAHRNQVLER